MDIRVHSTEQKDYLHRDWIAFGWTGGCVNFISDNIINLLTHVDDICVCVCSYVTCMWKTYTNIYTYLCLRRFVLCHIYIVVHTQSSVISILQTKLPPSLALENRAHHNWTSNVICSLLLLCFVRQIRHIIRRVLRTHRAMAALWREHVYSHYVCMCVCVWARRRKQAPYGGYALLRVCPCTWGTVVYYISGQTVVVFIKEGLAIYVVCKVHQETLPPRNCMCLSICFMCGFPIQTARVHCQYTNIYILHNPSPLHHPKCIMGTWTANACVM